MAYLNRYQVEGKGIYKDKKFGFSDCLSIFFSKIKELIIVNLLFCAFMIPFLIVSLLIAFIVMPDSGVFKDFTIQFTFQIMLIPIPFAFCGPFVAGLTKVTRDIAKEDHSFVLSDFIAAVKNNYKRATIISIIDYLFYVSALFALLVYWGTWVLFAVAIVTILYYSIMKKYIWLMVVSLDLNVRKMYKNGFLLVLACFKHSAKALLITTIASILVVMYLVLTLYTPITLIFFSALILVFQFSVPKLFANYYCFKGILEKVVDPYYNDMSKESTTDEIKTEINSKENKYTDEKNITERSEYVYENGKLVRRELLENQPVFNDKTISDEETEQ